VQQLQETLKEKGQLKHIYWTSVMELYSQDEHKMAIPYMEEALEMSTWSSGERLTLYRHLAQSYYRLNKYVLAIATVHKGCQPYQVKLKKKFISCF
jgi:hypothetical protein